MSRPAIYTPEEALERRRAGIRESVARHHARMISMTRLEKAAYKARASLGEELNPYTAEEAAAVASFQEQIRSLEASAERLNAQIQARLLRDIPGQPTLAPLLAELQNGNMVRIDLKPF